MRKCWILVLLSSLIIALLVCSSIPCLAKSYIGPERTPPESSTYKKALWPVTFGLKLPVQVVRYTTQGLILGIEKSRARLGTGLSLLQDKKQRTERAIKKLIGSVVQLSPH